MDNNLSSFFANVGKITVDANHYSNQLAKLVLKAAECLNSVNKESASKALENIGKLYRLINDNSEHIGVVIKESLYAINIANEKLSNVLLKLIDIWQNIEFDSNNLDFDADLNEYEFDIAEQLRSVVDNTIPILEEAELLEPNCKPIQEYKKSGKLSKEFIQWLIGTILAILAMLQAHYYHEEDKASDEPTTQIVINADIDSANYITQCIDDNIEQITTAEE